MPNKLKKVIGVILLIVSVSGVSCGSMLNAMNFGAGFESGAVEQIK